MKIIKRSGSEMLFDAEKITAAVRKANASVIDYEKLTELTAQQEAAQGELDALYEKWEQLTQEAGEA